MTEFERLDVDVIQAGLNTGLIGKELLVYNSTSSANDVAWEYSGNNKNDGLVVFAETQTAGRGRMGNKWLGGQCQSILCSILLLDCGYSAELLTIASAVAAAHALTACINRSVRIKWPNDIVIDGKKIAGILLESRKTPHKNIYVVGIGINCHQDKGFFENTELKMPATSVDIESKQLIDRNVLARQLLSSVDHWLQTAQQDEEKIVQQWQQFSSQLGHRITLQFNHRQFSGNCIGIDPAKGLILQLDNGPVRMFDAAHTTIVKHE